jgi:hypothetical protein
MVSTGAEVVVITPIVVILGGKDTFARYFNGSHTRSRSSTLSIYNLSIEVNLCFDASLLIAVINQIDDNSVPSIDGVGQEIDVLLIVIKGISNYLSIGIFRVEDENASTIVHGVSRKIDGELGKVGSIWNCHDGLEIRKVQLFEARI